MLSHQIKINKDIISDKSPVYIIGEIGSNHNKDFEEAKRLIDTAKETGCNAVKFQTYTAEGLYSKYTPRLSEMKGRSKEDETPFDLIKRIEMDWSWHKPLKDYCDEKEITFLSTPFDEKAVDILEQIDVEVYKIASYELVHIPLIRNIARTGKQ